MAVVTTQSLRVIAAAALLACLLMGCGQKGALYLPEDNPESEEARDE